MWPDATVGEQFDKRCADPARVRHIQWIEQAGAAGGFPNREQDRECGKLAYPRIAGMEKHHAASAR